MGTGLLRTLALGFVALLAAGTTADASRSAFPRRNGLIGIQLGADLVLVTPKGHVAKRIRRWSVTNDDPVWSPDGRFLAYGHLRRGGDAIEAWLADGSGRPIKRLVNETESIENCGTTRDDSLSWSPDGSRLLFSAVRAIHTDPPQCTYSLDLWTVSKNGGDPVSLLTAQGPRWYGCAGLSAPAWSPGGDIAFVGDEVLRNDPLQGPVCRKNIFVGHTDGTAIRRVTHSVKPDPQYGPEYGHIEWSPDGTSLLYTHADEDWLIRADGSGQRRVGSSAPFGRRQVSWAPNGRGLVFVALVPPPFKPSDFRMTNLYFPEIVSGTVSCAAAVAARSNKSQAMALKRPACKSSRKIWYGGPRSQAELDNLHGLSGIGSVIWQPVT